MNIVPDTTRLVSLEILLKKQLEKSGLFPVPLLVNCFLGEVLIILVDFPKNHFLNLKQLESYIYTILAAENLSEAYYIEIYYCLNGQYCCLDLQEEPSLLDIILWQFFYKILGINWLKKTIENIANNFKSNQLSWLVIGTSIGSLIILGTIYGLTLACLFDKCPQISQAKKLSDHAYILLNDFDSAPDLMKAKTRLEEAISLLQVVPFWSTYYQKSHSLHNKYQQQLDDLLLFMSAKEKANKALSLSQNYPLSIEQLEIVKKQWEEAIKSLKNMKSNTISRELVTNNYQIYQNALTRINDKISLEEKAKISIKIAKKSAELAKSREKSAQNLSDFQLVYSTWGTAIKKLQEISSTTNSYQSSRVLLKIYLSNKIRVEKRKQQEEVALKIYNKANHNAKLAQISEQKNQWSKAVNYWNVATTYIKKVPKNSLQGNKVQPLISAYLLSLNQAKKNLKEIIESQNIISELDAMCSKKTKICQYEITEKLIQMKLDSRYLEQLWTIALQAKAQANLQVQVELLNHISTFEHRLQKISNQTGKSIEVYNAQGNLMTVYHRQQ
ncbi:MAG: hypothetical protein WBM32_05865 [Crocosphaera sp.]|jgi:hypothetical protein